jgi:hypothetical protein
LLLCLKCPGLLLLLPYLLSLQDAVVDKMIKAFPGKQQLLLLPPFTIAL